MLWYEKKKKTKKNKQTKKQKKPSFLHIFKPKPDNQRLISLTHKPSRRGDGHFNTTLNLTLAGSFTEFTVFMKVPSGTGPFSSLPLLPSASSNFHHQRPGIFPVFSTCLKPK